MSATVVAGAALLDAITGDPKPLYQRFPHPVTVMANSLTVIELRLNRPDWSNRARRTLGAISIVAWVGAWGGAAAIVAAALSGPVGTVVLLILASTLLAGRDLMDHVRAVVAPLEPPQDIEAARAAVGEIVGRDASVLDAAGLSRGALESLCENLSDGFVAPLFWFVVAGFPGLVCYKAINTADSMIGHRNARFTDFGWAAARVDDLVNLVPARLTAMLIALAAWPEGRTGQAWTTAWRDARRHLSPNAGWPEAAMAGALDLRLGGPRRLGDQDVDGAWLGDGREDAGTEDLRRGLRVAGRVWIGLILLLLSMALVEVW